MRFLITGGRGFIGQHLARRLTGELMLLDTRNDGPVAHACAIDVGSVLDAERVDHLVAAHDLAVQLARVVEPLRYGKDALMRTCELET